VADKSLTPGLHTGKLIRIGYRAIDRKVNRSPIVQAAFGQGADLLFGEVVLRGQENGRREQESDCENADHLSGLDHGVSPLLSDSA